MTHRLYANGTGGVLGDELCTETELYMSGVMYFVHHTGDNANLGTSRQKPWATLVYALAHVAANDMIVLLDAHAETIAASQTLSLDGLKVVAEGSNNGDPTVELTSSLSDQSMFIVSGTNVALGNIKFMGGSTQTTVARVAVTGARSMIRDCYFECDAGLANNAALSWSIFGSGARLFNTKFVVTSTTVQPKYGLLSNGLSNAEMEACTFDGGDVGFSAGGYYDFSFTGVGSGPQSIRCQQMRLLNGAQFLVGTGMSGYLGISEKTGSPAIAGFAVRLPNGFRQTGDALLADSEVYLTTPPLYVHYGTGDDANGGTDELNT